DNDVLLAGEDVLDYHLRVELTGRGPRAVPLAEASLRVNGRDLVEPVGLMPGDRLEIGQNGLQLDVEQVAAPEIDGWRFYGKDLGEALIVETCGVGRGDDNQVQLTDDHISRR